MKKVLMFMAIMIAVVSLSSCNSLENKAKKQLHATMKELAKNPETYKITNEKVIFSNDSMCTISFIGSGQNGFGGYDSSLFEYTLIKSPKSYNGGATYLECILNMEKQYERRCSIKDEIYNIDNDFPYDSPNDSLYMTLERRNYDDYIKKGMSKEDAKANCLYIHAMANLITINGREIGNDD